VRHAAVALILLLIVGVLAFFAVSPEHGWWLPPSASTVAGEIDGLFAAIGVVITAGFVLVMSFLAWAVWHGARKRDGRARSSHGHTGLEMTWTAVVAIVLVGIAFGQLPTWAALRDPAAKPVGGTTAVVVAQQWSWHFEYAGEDGRLGTVDDLHTAFELVVPAGEPVLLELRARDVIHSFFVPELRVKQDVVPGRSVPLWFTIDRPGSFELVCAELCGLGHYAMAGRVRALPRAEYDAWLADRARDRRSRGSEDAR